MTARLVALVALALQLQPAVLPLLCDDVHEARAADCDESMSPAQAELALTALQGDAPCVNPALCGFAQAATPSSAGSTLAVSAGREGAQRLRPGHHTIEAPAPLPPPPEA